MKKNAKKSENAKYQKNGKKIYKIKNFKFEIWVVHELLPLEYMHLRIYLFIFKLLQLLHKLHNKIT